MYCFRALRPRLLAGVLLLALLSLSLGATAQSDDTPTAADPFTPVLVEVQAEDDKPLHGAYFAASDAPGPAVLLLHQLYADRHSWDPLTQALMDAGYKVLAVDLRGFGSTRGAINWTQAQQDTLTWAAWLAQQPGVLKVSMVGSSMGSSLALNGCLDYADCRAAVALSPGLRYFGVDIQDAAAAPFPKLVVYAENDGYPARAMPTLEEIGVSITFIAYAGRAHGVALFNESEGDADGPPDPDAIPQIVAWLNAYR